MADIPIIAADASSFQSRVQLWMQACFGAEVSADKLERSDRMLEEVLELLQSSDYPPERVSALKDYVFNRPIGDPHQEVGGVMLTLAAFCSPHGLDMAGAGEEELSRVWSIIDKIRAKQAAKPHGSALPVAATHACQTHSDPIGWWYQDSTGCIHMSLDMDLGHRHQRETGHALNLMYGKPLPSQPFGTAPPPQSHSAGSDE